MKTLKILAAAVASTLAVAVDAAPSGPGSAGCPAGAAPGSVACAGYGAGQGRGEGWKKWDANGDGKLSRDEVANAPRLSQQFDAIDADHDGYLSAEELQSARARFGGRGPNRAS